MLTPSNELEAVNTMLLTIGETPVSTIEDNGVVDAVIARQVLNEVSRQVQGFGWHFNTEVNFPMTPDVDGNLVLPENTLRCDSVKESAGIDVAIRGKRLYNRMQHTYVFSKGVKVDMVVFLEFDEIPEPARQYITIRAARVFQERVLGSGELSSFTQKDEIRALVSLKEMEADNADYNMLSGSYSVARVLDR